MRIAHNITALNAWRQMIQIGDQLGKSVEKISSGYRINRASDDPAGLVLSENLRAQVVGMDQALSNTQDGISMVQTAEGALTEIHSLLDSMRSLALHAANTAGLTQEAIAADQEQLDSAIESIERIATTTAYAGKKLLDGSIGKKVEIKNTDIVATASVGQANAPGISYVKVVVTTAATKANLGLSTGLHFTSAGQTVKDAGGLATGSTTTLNINGVSVTISGGMTASAVKSAINTALAASGVSIRAYFMSAGSISDFGNISESNTSGYLALVYTGGYGDDYLIDLYDSGGIIVDTGAGTFTHHARGTNIGGYFEYKRVDNSGTTYTHVNATGDGLTLEGNDDTALDGLQITLNSDYNATGTYTDVVRLYGDTTQFQIGANQGETYSFTIGNMTPSELGSDYTTNHDAGQRGLLALKTGGDYALASDPQSAIEVIDEAISDVSNERAKLGAIQAQVLESNYRNLGITRENLQASESRIRDVDMAKEMMEFTKNNVLTQAATAMLAQANTLPNTVLTLLR